MLGFYLATDSDAAEYFALRRQGTILKYSLSDKANALLGEAGVIPIPYPIGMSIIDLPGEQLIIEPSQFSLFNQLRQSKDIVVTPFLLK